MRKRKHVEWNGPLVGGRSEPTPVCIIVTPPCLLQTHLGLPWVSALPWFCQLLRNLSVLLLLRRASHPAGLWMGRCGRVRWKPSGMLAAVPPIQQLIMDHQDNSWKWYLRASRFRKTSGHVRPGLGALDFSGAQGLPFHHGIGSMLDVFYSWTGEIR